MDTTVDDMDNGIDPEIEVRKLQDLVKKLERQNQILRKQNRDPNTIIGKPGTEDDVNLSKQNRTGINDTDNIKDSLKKMTLEEMDLVDLDTVVLDDDDEETWLYKSPRRSSHSSVSPYKWLREEFEHPSPEVETARRSLVFKLDEVSRVSRSSSSGTLGSLTSPSSASGHLPDDSPSQPPIMSIGGISAPRQPVSGLGTRGINTGTFTRPKKSPLEKKRDPELIDDCKSSYINTGTFTRPKKFSPRKHPDLLDNLDSSSPVNTNTFTRPKKNKPRYALEYPDDSPDLDDSPQTDEPDMDEVNDIANDVANIVADDYLNHSQEHKFTDVDSLQVVARMQEESLRQSFSSPLMSPRKSRKLLRSLNRPDPSSSGGLHTGWLSQDEISHPSAASPTSHYNRSSHARFYVNPEEYKAKCMSKDSLASTASSHSNSNTSSPPSSPYGSQYLDQKTQVSETHRRSLPNLARTMNQGSLQTYPSDSRLQPRESPPRSLQKPSSSTTARRPRNPGSGARQASPGRTLSPGRTMSPGRSGIPTPRSSGIPRPGSASKLPTPRKSGIPSPRRSSNARADDSWKEGCY